MASCAVCQRDMSLMERVLMAGKGRCKQCDTQLVQEQRQWIVRIDEAFSRGGVSVEMQQAISQRFQQVRMPTDLGTPVMQHLQYLRQLSEIAWGNIPIIHTGIHLDSDEMAHFQIATTYHKPNKQIKLVPGQMIGTNKKLYFLSSTGKDSATIDWNNVSRVDRVNLPTQPPSPGVHITVSKGAGGGAYSVVDSLYTKIIIDTLVKLWKRQLVIYQETKVHGAIPEHVKAAVYKRDNGTCRECGYQGEYIEYDHIHPRSKGGTNTVDNIQLLCRKCNLKKSNRV